MRTAFADEATEGVLFADASNAFNRINRDVCLRNVQCLCPELATTLVNTYRSPAQLFVDGETVWSCEGTTQGDPLAMAMYAIATIPLIEECRSSGATQSWYADDATAASTLLPLRHWWDILSQRGEAYGYFLNPEKSVLLVKPAHLERATELFADTRIQVRSDGYRHLGAALGTPEFVAAYVTGKVNTWCKEVDKLSTFAHSQPHAAYSTFTHGLRHRWAFVARTVPNTATLLEPLEQAVVHLLLPALLGRPSPGSAERKILALPCRLGGLGLIIVSSLAEQFHSSCHITQTLVEGILSGMSYLPDVTQLTLHRKSEVRSRQRNKESTIAKDVVSAASQELQRCVELASLKGASNWLTCRPLKIHGFSLSKAGFRDAIHVRYGWVPPMLPSTCVCGQAFSTAHALSCPIGGYPSLRHNELRDITASLLSRVAHDVSVEPSLQPLSGERMRYRTAISEDGARLDVAASGVWGGRFERTFFDVRVFNPFVRSNTAPSLNSTFTKHEKEKRRHYEERVREVEKASFVPLVFCASGGQGKAASAFLKRIASMLAEKRKEPFSMVMAHLRCRLGFALIRSAIASLRGHRSRRAPLDQQLECPSALVNAECRLG